MKQQSASSILILSSCLITGISEVSWALPLYSGLTERPENVLVSLRSTILPLEATIVFPPPLGEIFETQCRDVPTGIGIPAFQPGISKNNVMQVLGVPTGTAQGYWPNTSAVYYDLIPEQISLGFLFDKSSERIRQTEASFTSQVDSRTVLLTLNGMLGCKLNEQIQKGLEQVWQQERRQFSFKLDYLKGIIERQKGDRIYIGIWEADLH